MLSYSNFSKHLSAVRETNAVVKRALDLSASDHGVAMESVKQWLQHHNIVGDLLRANLHQKQYVEQVRFGYMLDLLMSCCGVRRCCCS